MGEWNMMKLLIKIVKRPSSNISSFYILILKTVASIEGKKRKSSSPKLIDCKHQFVCTILSWSKHTTYIWLT